ncbi:Pycsar system effector family protein [Streptomyces sp. G-5]|uniref:Pycsar system effector family protein n=1 Tax=Streptomyces sp. G-5 TaxID=2977231 RepID=UPI0021D037B1|nr:Pycsar system effector family protein [Streptomyces sp. G-5]MCU4750271.1 DUF5706 domain-containing protein [Streptomyces sp. G-5]
MDTTEELISYHLNEALKTLDAELNATNTKAALLLALTGAGLVAVTSTAGQIDLPVVALSLGAGGTLALVAATLLLLSAVQPADKGQVPGTWLMWRTASHQEIRDDMAVDHRVERVKSRSVLVDRKMRAIRQSVQLIRLAVWAYLAASAAFAATAVLALV